MQALPFDEILGWQQYFEQFPVGWREDNRAAVQVMGFAGSKVKPEELFHSLKAIKENQQRRRSDQGAIATEFVRQVAARGGNLQNLDVLGITTVQDQSFGKL